MQVGDRIKLLSYEEIKALPGVYEEGLHIDNDYPCLCHTDWHHTVVIRDSKSTAHMFGSDKEFTVSWVSGALFKIKEHRWTFHVDWVVGSGMGSTKRPERHRDLRLIRIRKVAR